MKRLPKTGLIAPQPDGSATHFEVRAFAASVGVPEDPVTGSLNASLAQWLMGEGLVSEHYTVTQGTRLGRSGKVILTCREDQVWVGGQAVIRSTGEIMV
jgi:PhzF family phenazine biosynthesis protein